MRKFKIENCVKIGLFSSAGSLLFFGAVIFVFWMWIYDNVIFSQVVLKDCQSDGFKKWTEDKDPIYIRFYFFNWTNARSTLTRLEKPKFDELGPYVFRLRLLKDEIFWNENDTVSYRERKRYDFEEKLSRGSLQDEITTVNPTLHALFNRFKHTPKAWKQSINTIVQYSNQSLAVTKMLKELLMQGYKDSLLTAMGRLNRRFSLGMLTPSRGGYYYGKNLTDKYYFNVYSGKDDEKKLGLLNTFDRDNRSHIFSGSCDRIVGSTGQLWPRNIAEKDEAFFFIGEVRSSFKLKNIGSATAHDIEGTKFASTREIFDNGKENQKNRCYCYGECKTKWGVRNYTDFFLSLPHFHLADSSYRGAIEGMRPDPKKHEFYVIFQKDSGIVLDAVSRLQINMLMEPIDGIALLTNVSEIMMPIFWYEASANLTKETIDKKKLAFKTIPLWCLMGSLSMTVLGAATLSIAFLYERRIRLTKNYKI